LISTLRLFKNLALTRLAWRLKVQKLMRRKTLVIIDRYFYNYYLDPVSVRYYGPSSLVDKVRPAFPRPDLIVVLKAPAATLRARKQELSEEQIHQQSAVLQQIALDSPQSMVVDATRPAAEIAREVLARIETLTHLASQESRSP
jgi:thymidylate kinase